MRQDKPQFKIILLAIILALSGIMPNIGFSVDTHESKKISDQETDSKTKSNETINWLHRGMAGAVLVGFAGFAGYFGIKNWALGSQSDSDTKSELKKTLGPKIDKTRADEILDLAMRQHHNILNEILIVSITPKRYKRSSYLTNEERARLNSYFGKSYISDEWDNLVEIDLRGMDIPEDPFPSIFYKLINRKLKVIELRKGIRRKDSSVRETIRNSKDVDREVQIEKLDNLIGSTIYLGGVQYKLTEIISKDTKEGCVYKIVRKDKSFALKVYLAQSRSIHSAIRGDVLVIAKARASRNFLVLPVYVNIELEYSIFPFVSGATLRGKADKYNIPDHCYIEMHKFHADILDEKLEKDGLRAGDRHPGNYMRDENGNICRIDFGEFWDI